MQESLEDLLTFFQLKSDFRYLVRSNVYNYLHYVYLLIFDKLLRLKAIPNVIMKYYIGMTKIKLAKEEDNADQGGHIYIFFVE